MPTATWSDLHDAGDFAGARVALRERFEAGDISAREAAIAAERAGDVTLALRAWQMVLRDHPDDLGAWAALAALHEARGDQARAQDCRKRAGAASPSTSSAPPHEPTGHTEAPLGEDSAPSDADLIRFAALFSGREGVHARMWRNADGHGYSPVEQSLSPEILRAHVAGDMTLGVYLVRSDNTVTCCCFDLDVTKRAIQDVLGDAERTRALRSEMAAEGVTLCRRLRALGLDPLFVDSGWKGRHLWCFLPSPVPADTVLTWGRAMVTALRPTSPRLAIEFFPKQATVSRDGVGNLVKLPLGLHLGSGRRAVLLGDDGTLHPSPWSRLRGIRRCALPEAPDAPPLTSPPGPDAAPFSPAPGPGDWLEADFEASPEVGPIYRGCPVIRSIVEQALRERRLDRDEAVVIEHSLGHLPDGVRAVNYVLDRVPGYPAEMRMGSPHRGSPISCQRIRQRAPGHARRVGCDCPFTPRPGEYANPLLHRAETTPRKADPTLDDTFEQLARAEDRLRTVHVEVQHLRAMASRRLADVPGRRWAVRGGEWTLVDEDGVASLRWTGG